MWKLGQPVFDVLHATVPGNVLRLLPIGFPESGFINPVRFPEQSVGKSKRVEHFHRSTRNAIRTPALQRAFQLLNDTSADVGKSGQLCRQRETGGSATDNKYIDL